MSFAIYLLGFVILIGGLAYGASMAGLSTQWIVVGALVVLGMGVALPLTWIPAEAYSRRVCRSTRSSW